MTLTDNFGLVKSFLFYDKLSRLCPHIELVSINLTKKASLMQFPILNLNSYGVMSRVYIICYEIYSTNGLGMPNKKNHWS